MVLFFGGGAQKWMNWWWCFFCLLTQILVPKFNPLFSWVLLGYLDLFVSPRRHALGAKAHHTVAKGTKVSGGAREFFFAASNIPFGYVKIAMEHGPNFVDLPSNVTSTIVKGRPPYIFFLGGVCFAVVNRKSQLFPKASVRFWQIQCNHN